LLSSAASEGLILVRTLQNILRGSQRAFVSARERLAEFFFSSQPRPLTAVAVLVMVVAQAGMAATRMRVFAATYAAVEQSKPRRTKWKKATERSPTSFGRTVFWDAIVGNACGPLTLVWRSLASMAVHWFLAACQPGAMQPPIFWTGCCGLRARGSHYESNRRGSSC
jgi:hypothetical protein